MRRFVVLVGLIMLVLQVQPAAACSMVFPTIEIQTEFAEIIAIGNVTSNEESVATIEVTEYLKGSSDETITVLNRTLSIGPDCSVSLSADDKGFRFAKDTILLMFLKKSDFDLGATWQEAMPTGLSILPIRDDAIQFPNQNGGNDVLTLKDIRAKVNATLVTLPTPLPDGTSGEVPPVDPLIDPPNTIATEAPVFLSTPTPFGAKPNPDAEATTPSWTSTTLPWILLVIGILSGIGALWGWRGERKQ